jgi:LEA14-like dessication related protein
MADNIEITPGTGSTIGADDIDSVLYQRVKIITGDNNVNDGDVSSSNPMPTEEANSADIKTAVELIDDAIDGTEMQVDVVAPLPAGTNAIGKLAANSGVDIGDVDVISCALPTGAATSAKQDAAEALLTMIDEDTSDIATDTGTIAADTTSIDGKITACDTGDVTIGAALPAGTNLLGKVGIDQTTDGTTNKVSLSTDVVSVDATGQGDVPITLDGETVTVDLGANNDVTTSSGKTIKRAIISASSSGDNTIVAAVADKKIKVLSVLLVAAEATTVRFESGASGDALTGVMSLEAKAGFVIPAPADASGHWFETGVNTLLNLELGGAVQVSGCITYYEEA